MKSIASNNAEQLSATGLVIDTETDQGRDPRPVQVATIDVLTGQEWMSYFNSGRPISAFVTKIHGITDADVAGCPRFQLEKFQLSDYLIGHNVRFDWGVIGRPSVKLICTVRMARAAFPEWQGYSQSRCIEQLIGKQQAASMTALAHDALGDARMCYLLYQACCERLNIEPTDFEAAHRISNTAKPLAKMPFGKYKGQLISSVPIGYIKWMLGNIDSLTPALYSALQQRLRQQDAALKQDDVLNENEVRDE
ncbi:putative quorum-sensing-regulated virulence factor [Psychrobacter sp. FDAARGOS_221]|uniref:putative quorum-sensing-regulated virulence factor n=1 Tax=Psychrobacter sp. FDAARGOS_221 TaxID=1975705 RepID=UPI000BB5348B|nr:DUF3820 family protein [Psychrobacter sp. FDAARGOS_221]PNK61264.1 exonuclease [Psychrobacter sp. FDAARGOS_221]